MVSAEWVKAWKDFVLHSASPPGPIDNSVLVDSDGIPYSNLIAAKHYKGVNEVIWKYWITRYGGGPVIARRTFNIYEDDKSGPGTVSSCPNEESAAEEESVYEDSESSDSICTDSNDDELTVDRLPVSLASSLKCNFDTRWRPRISPLGITNEGNTCFMNATLQSFVPLEAVVADAIRHSGDGEFCKIFSLVTFELRYKSIFGEVGQSLDSRVLRMTLKLMRRTLPDLFGLSSQQDCHEFLMRLLDNLHEEMINGNGCVKEVPWKNLKKSTFIFCHFAGQLRSRITCHQCGAVSDSHEVFLELSLPIPERKHKSCGDVVSLKSCIDAFFQEDNVEFYCNHCRRTQAAVKSLTVTELPNILILHMKRFNTSLEKITSKVHFDPEIFYMTSGRQSGAYQLSSLVEHRGGDSLSGHYINYSRFKNDATHSWWCIDDDCRYKVSPECIADSQAYLMFFTKLLKE
eukprot:GHVL01009176.1.p1 GENE.GHVL01009176.1~~GHVL01009176.1.p1  ORF type:complete len:460 (+),score=84.30 GHVL01009176.1:200-1579(+)